jgi:chemotaxis response regulator CheB
MALIKNRFGDVRFRRSSTPPPGKCLVQSTILSSIGGFSGAAVPLKGILAALPADFPAAIFVVLHIAARGIGVLATVASGAGKLPVRQAENGLSVENGHVYLAAPDRHLMLVDGHIMLGSGPPENMSRPAIDPLFRSAALHYGPRVNGVVLSGLLCDGAAGLNVVKRCGGVAVVQDPADAIADEMPRRALEATTVDLWRSYRPAWRRAVRPGTREAGSGPAYSPRDQAGGRDRLGRTHRQRQFGRDRRSGHVDLPELRLGRCRS